jgi:serine/threonine protein kinase
MAPEVAMEERYTEKADVYSFGILLWQVVALKEPYGRLHGGKIEYSVCQLGLRPEIDPGWPLAIIKLLENCFARQPAKRPSMDVVCAVLQREACSLSDKKFHDQEWLQASKSALSARYYDD